MAFKEEEFLQISGVQHYLYCPRQWAMIHIEQQWEESYHTADGRSFHARTHDSSQREKRGDLLIVRGLPVSSAMLGISGVCDVVEFRRSDTGVSLFGEQGTWQPYPVEYKRGRPKEHDADALQLCCQAMCLEEQLLCHIPEGSLYYGQTRRRERVALDETLREKACQAIRQMRQLFERGYTPKAKGGKRCGGCSLKEICLPGLPRQQSVADYLAAGWEERE